MKSSTFKVERSNASASSLRALLLSHVMIPGTSSSLVGILKLPILTTEIFVCLASLAHMLLTWVVRVESGNS